MADKRGWQDRLRLGFWYRAVGAIVLLCAAGFALIYVSFLVPNGPQLDHLRQSFAETELHDPRLRTRVVQYAPRRSQTPSLPMRQSECRTVTIGITDSHGNVRSNTEWPSLRDAALSPTFGAGEKSCKNLRAMLFPAPGEQPVDQIKPQNYYRYWHGYSVITRPLMAVVSFDRVRQLLWLAVFGLGAGVAAMCWKRGNATLAAAVIAPAVILNYERIGQLITDSWCWLIAFSAAIAALRILGRSQRLGDSDGSQQTRLMWVLLLAGFATAYLDRITIPLLTLSFPLLIIVVSEHRAATGRRDVGATLRCQISLAAWLSGAWLFGYASTFVARWVIAAIATGGDSIGQLRTAAGRRAYGDGEDFGFFAPITRTIARALASTTRLDVVLLLAAVVAIAAIPALRRRFVQAVADQPLVPLLLIAPVPWLLALHDHSTRHAFFTQYIWYPSMVGVFYLGFEVVRRVRGTGTPPEPDSIPTPDQR